MPNHAYSLHTQNNTLLTWKLDLLTWNEVYSKNGIHLYSFQSFMFHVIQESMIGLYRFSHGLCQSHKLKGL